MYHCNKILNYSSPYIVVMICIEVRIRMKLEFDFYKKKYIIAYDYF